VDTLAHAGLPIGKIVGDSRPDYFIVSLDPDHVPPLYDYVYVEVEEVPPGEDEPRRVKVIAQIRGIKRQAVGIGPEHPWQVVRRLNVPAASDTVIAYAKVLGYKWKGRILLPRRAPPVGSWVYLAPDDLLEDFFSVSPERRLHLGYLITRPSVSAYLDVEGIKRHVAIIAATGAGKTWASVVLIEELLKKGATIVVLDPHGEYVAMKKTACRLGPEYCDSVVVFKARRDQEGDYQYRISVDTLTAEELATVAGVPSKASRIRSVIASAKEIAGIVSSIAGSEWKSLRGIIRLIHYAIDAAEFTKIAGSSTNLSRFVEEFIRRISQALGREVAERIRRMLDYEEAQRAIRRLWLALRKDSEPGYDAVRYLEGLDRLGVYGVKHVPIDQLLQPGRVTVINLAGLSDEVQDHVVYNVLARVFSARVHHVRGLGGESYPYPVVVIVEEAHRFMPPKTTKQTKSRGVAATIASEGRKFGVYMVAITQRPSRIDADVLSQLQGQIILRVVNPRDQDAIRDASEQMSQDLLENLPGLNTGEAVVIGPLAPAPLMVRIRDRVLEYSGKDISLVEAWGGSRDELKLIEDYRLEALKSLRRLLEQDFEDLHEALTVALRQRVDPETVELGLRLLARSEVWASFDEYTGVVYGEAGGYDVRIPLGEGNPSCGCQYRKPCPHAIAVLVKALADGLIARRTVIAPDAEW
jgi:DNA helicase HerA-like ATPase